MFNWLHLVDFGVVAMIFDGKLTCVALFSIFTIIFTIILTNKLVSVSCSKTLFTCRQSGNSK